MALGRKGARRIVGDGTAYRWRLRCTPTYFQGLAWSPSTFAVEYADTPGTTLLITTDQPHLNNWIGRGAEPVLPPDVVQAIERALREGWTPTAPGSTFHLDLSDGFTPSPSAGGRHHVRPVTTRRDCLSGAFCTSSTHTRTARARPGCGCKACPESRRAAWRSRWSSGPGRAAGRRRHG